MLDNEFNYYKKNQSELVKKYDGKYIVIIGDEVIAAYDSKSEAYSITSKDHEVGTFLIQYVSQGKKDFTVTYHSRVIV
ncbi:MAG: hypothetical protein IIB39_05880 [Candidatus Marinimicrobia bacterium]|nr:hypothetical protein [Candidatus Neomarinimicrobiota bacterium]